MKFRVGCKLKYWVPQPSTFFFNLAAAERPRQAVERETISFGPEIEPDTHTDTHSGNRYHRFRTQGQGRELHVSYEATVSTTPLCRDPMQLSAVPPHRLPLETLPYLLPSRYCQSDQLMRLAHREFGRAPPGYPQVQAICDWIYRNVDYLAGTTTSLTSAYDTATERAGVCRDFAHLGIAFCRAVNIPARFVSAYAYNLNPPDFHAVFEAWLDGAWYLFDPTRRAPTAGLVRIGTGRDASEVSFALIIGGAKLSYMDVHAIAAGGEDEAAVNGAAGLAISLA